MNPNKGLESVENLFSNENASSRVEIIFAIAQTFVPQINLPVWDAAKDLRTAKKPASPRPCLVEGRRF